MQPVPPMINRETIRVEIEEDIQTILQQVVVPIELPCGGEGWQLSAYLNMTDPLQSCPSAWGYSLEMERGHVEQQMGTYLVFKLCIQLVVGNMTKYVGELLATS